VQLFENLRFADFTPKTFGYAPPSGCTDFTVTAGRQFDRTAAFYLGHASIYYGTTGITYMNRRLNYSFVVNADGTATQIVTSDQRDLERESRPDANGRVRTLDNQVHATDTLQFDASFNILGNSGSQTTQSYRSQDVSGGCYSRTLKAQAQKLVSVSDGGGCEELRATTP
jgi:hypothetical protein